MFNVKLTFEECCTLLAQIVSCVNSIPLVSLPCEGEGIDVLTSGHFLIGRSMEITARLYLLMSTSVIVTLLGFVPEYD